MRTIVLDILKPKCDFDVYLVRKTEFVSFNLSTRVLGVSCHAAYSIDSCCIVVSPITCRYCKWQIVASVMVNI